MDPKKAIQIIKGVIDASIKAGVIPNLEYAQTIAQAYAILSQTIDTYGKL
jgi:hypothetical protein